MFYFPLLGFLTLQEKMKSSVISCNKCQEVTYEQCTSKLKGDAGEQMYSEMLNISQRWKLCKEQEKQNPELKSHCDALFQLFTLNRKCWSAIFKHNLEARDQARSNLCLAKDKMEKMKARAGYIGAIGTVPLSLIEKDAYTNWKELHEKADKQWDFHHEQLQKLTNFSQSSATDSMSKAETWAGFHFGA